MKAGRTLARLPRRFRQRSSSWSFWSKAVNWHFAQFASVFFSYDSYDVVPILMCLVFSKGKSHEHVGVSCIWLAEIDFKVSFWDQSFVVQKHTGRYERDIVVAWSFWELLYWRVFRSIPVFEDLPQCHNVLWSLFRANLHWRGSKKSWNDPEPLVHLTWKPTSRSPVFSSWSSALSLGISG